MMPEILFTFFIIFQTKFIYTSGQGCWYDNCLSCLLCGSESNTKCDCKWDNRKNECFSLILGYKKISEWYNELSNCDSINLASTYCSTKINYTLEDFVDDKIIINLYKDSNNKYGQYFMYCYYEFVDEKQENSYDIYINYTSGIRVFLKPKIAFSYSMKENNNLSENIEEVSDNYEKSFNKLYNLKIWILLKDNYDIMPVSFVISKAPNLKSKLLISFIIGFLFLIIIFTIIWCTSRYLNKKTREHLILLRVQRDLNNIQPVHIDSEVDKEDLKRKNTKKLNKLFETKLAEHPYKKEYNQYGGGCSICLENFNKKSKVSITSCSHVFHYKCIYEWLFKNILCPKCPNCNNEILNDPKNNEDNINNNNIIDNERILTIQIKKKENNKKKKVDVSSQNEFLNNGTALELGERSNENIKRKTLNTKKKK